MDSIKGFLKRLSLSYFKQQIKENLIIIGIVLVGSLVFGGIGLKILGFLLGHVYILIPLLIVSVIAFFYPIENRILRIVLKVIGSICIIFVLLFALCLAILAVCAKSKTKSDIALDNYKRAVKSLEKDRRLGRDESLSQLNKDRAMADIMEAKGADKSAVDRYKMASESLEKDRRFGRDENLSKLNQDMAMADMLESKGASEQAVSAYKRAAKSLEKDRRFGRDESLSQLNKDKAMGDILKDL